MNLICGTTNCSLCGKAAPSSRGTCTKCYLKLIGKEPNMKNVEIEVHLLGKMQIQKEAAEKWLKSMGVGDDAIDRLINDEEKTDAEMGVELAGRRCYKSFEPKLNPNVTKIREDIGEYIDNILKVGHGSVIEHMYFMFGLEGITRVCTAELNRHRAGAAISEGSMRYIRLDDIPFWMPNCLRSTPEDLDAACDDESLRPLEEKKDQSRTIFNDVFTYCGNKYSELMEIWKDELSDGSQFKGKKEVTSMMRRIVPIGVSTGGVWTYNLRALRHIFTMRCSAHAEEEILELGCKMLEIMQKEEPNFFKDFEKVQGYWKPKYFKV